MAADSNDQNAEYALSKLLQMDEAFSLALAAEARFTDLQLLEFLRSYPSTLGEAFFRARITEAHFEDEINQAVDANVGNQEEPEADDDTNINDFGCSLPHHKGVDLTVEEVLLENIKSDLEEDEDDQDSNTNGVFNDVVRVGYSKADGTWVPARGIEDGWHLFDELGSKLYFEYSIKNVHQLSDDKHADYNKKHKRGIRRGVWDPGIKKKFRHHLEGKVVVKEWGMIRPWSYLVSQLVKQVIVFYSV
ncbi:hypothetical protein Tco_0581792 [Tanacetum coccineum]